MGDPLAGIEKIVSEIPESNGHFVRGIVLKNFHLINGMPDWPAAVAKARELVKQETAAARPQVTPDTPIDPEDALALRERDLRLSVRPDGPRLTTLGDAIRSRQRRRHSHVFGQDSDE